MTSTPPATRSSLDARSARARSDSGVTPAETTQRHPMSLLWWVFLANGAVLLLALLLLAFSPIEIDAPIEIEQFALLLAGFVVLVGLDFVLLRRVLAPLFRLTEVMSSVDPDRPGRRLSGVDPRSAEGQAMARAFNSMLDRLENARHEAARTALAAQEAERLRVARELHDEIGQTLTASRSRPSGRRTAIPRRLRMPIPRGSRRRPRSLTKFVASRVNCGRKRSTISVS